MGKPRSMAEARAECAALGIQPGRSVAECEKRIAEHKAQRQADFAAAPVAFDEVGEAPRRMSRTMREMADGSALRGPVLCGHPYLYVGNETATMALMAARSGAFLTATQTAIAQWRGRQLVKAAA